MTPFNSNNYATRNSHHLVTGSSLVTVVTNSCRDEKALGVTIAPEEDPLMRYGQVHRIVGIELWRLVIY